MKLGDIILLLVLAGVIGAFVADRYYVSKFEEEFRVIENKRIVTSNKLATAKIVHENLNHVRELVFENMDFPGQKDSITHETRIFDFVTTCINDLKMKLVSVKPLRPTVSERITTYGYDIEMEGDFFKYGELCSKFENSRRIMSIENFSVQLLSATESRVLGTNNKGIRVTMRVNTFRVRKDPAPIEPVTAEKG